MWKDWLIAGPLLGYCVFVVIRQLRGKGKSGCGRHSVYGIPDEGTPEACQGCPLKAGCKKQQKPDTE